MARVSQPAISDALSDQTSVYSYNSTIDCQKPITPIAPTPLAYPSPGAAARPSVVAPAVLGASAVLLAAAGTGGYLSAWGDYQSSVSQCQRMCDPAQLGSLPDQVRTAEITGGVLWGLAAAAATVDVILWIRWGKR